MFFRRSPYRRSPYRRSPYRRSPYRRSPYRRSPYRRSPYRRSPYRQYRGGMNINPCGFNGKTKRCNKKNKGNRQEWCILNPTTGYCVKSKIGINDAPKSVERQERGRQLARRRIGGAVAQEVVPVVEERPTKLNVMLYPEEGIKPVTNEEFQRLYRGIFTLNSFKDWLKSECDEDNDDIALFDDALNFVEAIIIFVNVSSYDTSEFNLLGNGYNIEEKDIIFGDQISRLFPYLRL